MNKPLFLPLLLVVLCLPATAVELGPLQARSHLNQPLDARLPLRGVGEGDLAELRFSLADRATYRRYRLRPPFDPQSVDISAVVNERGQPELHIRSRQPVADPIVDILLKVMSRRDGRIHRYTLFLDPPGIAPLAAPLTETEPGGSQPARPTRAPTPTANGTAQPAPAPSARTGMAGFAPETRGNREFVQEKGLSISMIAQNSKLHEKYSVYQIMRAVYITNPDAFADGNINRLIYGSRLLVPAESLIAEVPRLEAIGFVKAVSRDNPATLPTLLASRGASRTATPKTVSEAGNTASGSNAPAPVAGNRQPAQKTPAEIVGVLLERSERRRAASGSVNRQPGTATPAMTTTDSDARVERQAAAQERQVTDRSREIAELDREVQQKDPQIRNSTRPSEALQRAGTKDADTDGVERPVAQSGGAQQRMDSPEPAVSKAVSAAVVSQSPAPASETIRSLMIWGLPALSLLIALIAGSLWWIRARRGPSADLPLERLLAEAAESQSGGVDIDITETALRSVPSPAAEPTPLTVKPVSANDDTADNTQMKAEELILEIDVRLAYELYPEALEMLQQARQEYGDAVWIDAKTLETYAAMGKRQEFLALFAQKRDALRSASPIVWAEISGLHDEITRQSKISSTG